MHILYLVIYLGCVALVGAAPHSYIVHEKRDVLSSNWEKRDRLHPQDTLPLRIGLTQSNLVNGHNLLMDMYVYSSPLSHLILISCRSDPASSNYGKHWTSDEVIEMFAPSNETV